MRSVPVGPILLAALVLSVVQISEADAAVPEGAVEFQDGAGNAVDSVKPDQRLKIYVRDKSLNTLGTCTATWTELPATVRGMQQDELSLSTGAPHSEVYSLNEGCAYDRETPSNTPFALGSNELADVDLPDGGWVPVLVVCCPDTDHIEFQTNVDTGSTITFEFNFNRVDSYDVSDQRVKVFSESDSSGEWIAISEVASETDASPALKSSLFLGEATLSPDTQTNQAGDATVWVQPGDEVTVGYYEEDGATLISSDAVMVEAPPVPGVTGVGLAVLAGLLAAAAAFRVLRSERARSLG